VSPTPSVAANAGRDASGVRRVERTGLSRTVAIVVAVVLAAVIVVLDQLSKHWAETSLAVREPRAVVGELLQFRLLYNSGAAWGMGSGITPVVTLVQIAICIGALVYVVRSVRSVPWALALGCIVGGALGNIHDRILRAPSPFHGEVVDFIELPHWPVFNVADMAVVVGAVLIVLLGVLGVASDPAARDQTADAAETSAAETAAADTSAVEASAAADGAGEDASGSDAAADTAAPAGREAADDQDAMGDHGVGSASERRP